MVFQCKKCKKSDIPLFILPLDPSLRLEWCVRLGLDLRDADENRSKMRICADHFEPSCISTVNKRSALISGSIPNTELSVEQVQRLRNTWKQTYPERDRLFPALDVCFVEMFHVAMGRFLQAISAVSSGAAGTSVVSSTNSPTKRKVEYKESPKSTPSKRKLSDHSTSVELSQPGASSSGSSTSLSESKELCESEDITEVCLAYVEQIEILLQSKCQTNPCDSAVLQINWKRHGSCFVAKMECINGHVNTWSTQPPAVIVPYGRPDFMHRGNLDLTSATIAGGLSYADIHRFAEVIDLAIISEQSFLQNQKYYVMPTVDEVYAQHMDQVHNVFAEEEDSLGPLTYAADAQCDSPGYCANMCCETFMENSTGLIASMNVVHKTETVTGTSQAMEPLGFQRCLDELLSDRNRKISAIATDNHGSINRIMRQKYAQIIHELDKWHVGKNLKKRLFAAAKMKEFIKLQPWIRSILNHLWYSVENCQRNPVRCQEMFRSIAYHISNEHSWPNDNHFSLVSTCAHTELTTEKVASTGWLPKDSEVWRKLFRILNEKRLQNNISRISLNLTTSAIENYHSIRLIYATKRKAYRYAGYRMRSQLAVLHHNYATMGKEVVLTADGKVQLKVAYSKPADRWTEKIQYMRPSPVWKRGLLRDIRLERLNFLLTGKRTMLQFPNIPSNAAPMPRPIYERTEELFDSDSDDSNGSDSE